MKKTTTNVIFLLAIVVFLLFPQKNYSSITTTNIELVSFYAVFGDGQVTLKWETATETDNYAFNIYRAESETGDYTIINDSQIPAEGSAIQGASYEFPDNAVQNGKTYYYKLEDIGSQGSTFHGPIIAKACPSQTECDDGFYCNGVETCQSGSCVNGPSPCAEGQCNEDLDQCISNSSSTSTTTVPGSTSTSTTVPGGTTTTTIRATTSINTTSTTSPVTTSATTTSPTSTTTTAQLSTTTTKPTTTTTARSGPCAAEAIYGENAEETELLRKYRDNVLSKTPEGQEIIKTYYKFSPKVTMLLGQRPLLKNRAKTFIDGMLPGIRKKIEESNKKP